MLILKIPNKGERPAKLSEEMIWEILAIKSEFSTPAWKLLKNAKQTKSKKSKNCEYRKQFDFKIQKL